MGRNKKTGLRKNWKILINIMKNKKQRRFNDDDFTARVGVLCFISLFFLLVLGGSERNEPKPQLLSPIVEAQEMPQASPTPLPTPKLTQREKVEREIERVFGEKAELAKKVAFCESSLNPKATHKDSTATGLFQILRGTFRQFKCSGDPLNYQDNIKCAKKIYDYYGEFGTRGGWAASRSCWQ